MLLRVDMALQFFPYLSGGLQRNYIITSSRGITLYLLTSQVELNEILLLRIVMALDYFLTRQVDCNEFILLRVYMALHFIF
jgi:hypothetical protein